MMKMAGRVFFLNCVCVALWFASYVAAAGPKIELGPDSWLQLGYLGQAQATHTEDTTPETDLFLRRTRIMLSGQVIDGVQFFAQTDCPNAGRYGSPNEIKMQDVFVDLRLPYLEDHWFKAGLILLPFSFESRSSAATLLGHDYNFEVIKLPNTFIWRDLGAELHGTFWDQRIAYFVGVFDGYDLDENEKNPDADLRLTGHLTINLLGEAESGWFFNQCRLGKSGDYLSVGAGFDRQGKATRTIIALAEGEPTPVPPPEIMDSENWVVDLQSGFDLQGVGLTLNAAWYDWDNALFRGNTAFVETGLLIGKLMPVAKYSWQEPEDSSTVDDYTVGLHIFGKGHNIRGGIEYRWGDSPSQWLVGVQVLL